MRFKQMQYLSTIFSAAILLFMINPALANSSNNKNLILSNIATQQSGTDPQADLLIKSSSEPDTAYQTDNVYQQVPSDQQIKTIDSVKGNPVTFQVKIQNDSDNPQSYYLKTIESADTGWMVNYTVDSSSNIINTFAGGGISTVDGMDAKSYKFNFPSSIAYDHRGNLYIGGNTFIWQIGSDNKVYRVTGNGNLNFSGDGGSSLNANISDASSIALDANDNLYFSDCGNQRVRCINAITGIITTIAGTGVYGYSGDGGSAANAQLNYPKGLAIDSSGNIYIADSLNNRIRKIDAATHIISTFAGTGNPEYNGDGIAASEANLNNPSGMVFDSSDNIYITELTRIRKINLSTGLIQTIAGNGYPTHNGDGGPATQAGVTPDGICLDEDSNIYIAEGKYIRRIDTRTWIITTIAGNGSSGFSGDGGPAVLAGLNMADGIVSKDHGSIYIADSYNQRIRVVESASAIQYALTSGGYTTDVIPAHGSIIFDVTMTPNFQALPNTQKSVTINAYSSNTDTVVRDSVEAITYLPSFSAPDLLIKSQSEPNTSYKGNRIYESIPSDAQTLSQNISLGDSAQFSVMLQNKGDQAQSFLLKSAENKLAAWSCTYSTQGVDITTDIAGSGYTTPILDPGSLFTLDITETPNQAVAEDVPKTAVVNVYNDINDTTIEDSVEASATISGPDLLIKGKSDPDTAYETSNVYQQIPDGKQIKTFETVSGNPASFSIRLQNNTENTQSYYLRTKESNDAGWTVNYSLEDKFRKITTYAGGGINTTDGIDAKLYELVYPYSVALGHNGELYIGCLGSIKRVDSNGKIYTIAGNGIKGFSGDGGPAINASVSNVYGLAVDASNNLYFTDYDNNRVRCIDSSTGIITTIAGNGNAGFSGDGGPAADAILAGPYGIAIDTSRNIYISDGNRIRLIDAVTRNISTYAGTGQTGYNGDGISALEANLGRPKSISIDLSGDLYIADYGNCRIRKIDGLSRLIQTIAGNGSSTYSGDGGLGTQTGIPGPTGICLDKDSNIYLSCNFSCSASSVFGINAKTGILSKITGNKTLTSSGDGGPSIFAGVCPLGIIAGNDGSIYIADFNYSGRIRLVEPANTIQSNLNSNGYYVSAIPGQESIVIDATLTPDTTKPVGSTKSVTFEVYSSSTDSNIRDSVEAVAQIATSATYTSPTGFIRSGWNCISLPTDPVNPDPLTVFAGINVANSSFQYWDNTADPCTLQEYGSALGWTGPVVRGIPYWFIQSSNSSEVALSYQGIEPITDFVMTVPAHTAAPYWIAVGTPFPSAVSADAILFKDISKRGDNWLTWSDAYSTSDTDLRIVDSSMQGWDNTQGSFIRIAPSAFATANDKTQFDPWWGYWLLVTDKNELQIKFPKLAQ